MAQAPVSLLKELLEAGVGEARFNMRGVVTQAIPELTDEPFHSHWEGLKSTLGEEPARRLMSALLRAAFFIELVKVPKIETTKFEVRWGNRLDPNDPRYASFEECLRILFNSTEELVAATSVELNRDLLLSFLSRPLYAYEIPVDYIERFPEGGGLHTTANVEWEWGEIPKRTILLRRTLLDKVTNPYSDLFALAYDKIRVKTYLTDRVLTGAYKTNREKRWETHPSSVHFALRRACMEIEYVLVNQLCHFEGFPADIFSSLESASLLTTMDAPSRCPVTLEPLHFFEFERELRDPEHGKANFQVGHLNPLKAIGDDPESGHTARNISWISSDGNRIQGHRSLEESRQLIRRISRNYKELGLSEE